MTVERPDWNVPAVVDSDSLSGDQEGLDEPSPASLVEMQSGRPPSGDEPSGGELIDDDTRKAWERDGSDTFLHEVITNALAPLEIQERAEVEKKFYALPQGMPQKLLAVTRNYRPRPENFERWMEREVRRKLTLGEGPALDDFIIDIGARQWACIVSGICRESKRR